MNSPGTAFRISFLGTTVFVLLLLALHFLRRDLDPSWHFISEYAVGQHGWLMHGAFVAWTIGFTGLALALHGRMSRRWGRIALVMLWISAAGTLLAALFKTDPILTPADARTFPGMMHEIGGALGMAIPIAIGLISWRLLRSPDWAPHRRMILTSALIAFLGVVYAIASMAVEMSEHQGTFGPDVEVGWPNRLEVLGFCSWLLCLAWCGMRLSPTPALTPVKTHTP